MSTTILWWVAAGLAVAAELATGTFYLLMLSLGLASGAIAAWLGAPLMAQILCAAVVASGAIAGWQWHRRGQPGATPAATDRDVNLDIGAEVHVAAWKAEGATHVRYRGSDWSARLAPGSQPTPGPCRVVAVEGNWLVLEPLPSSPSDS